MNLERAIKLIREFEGCALVAYNDGGGVWTLGWGHTRGVKPGDTCTREQADAWLEDDIQEAWVGVQGCVGTAILTEGQACALVSFVYNLGAPALERSMLLRFLKYGDVGAAASEFKRWVFDNGKLVAGLQRRRAAERDLFMS